MNITFELNSTDIRAFQRHARSVMPEYRRSKWINVGIAAIIATLVTSTNQEPHSFAVKALTFFIIFVAIWGLIIILDRVFSYFIMAIRPKGNGLSGILCEHSITIDAEGLTEITPVNESKHHWKGIFLVASTTDHILSTSNRIWHMSSPAALSLHLSRRIFFTR